MRACAGDSCWQQVGGEPKYEIVRDPAVIVAYLRKRQVIEEETTLADTLAPTGDAEKDARAKKRCVLYLHPGRSPRQMILMPCSVGSKRR
jgi:hypothetical protein